MADIGSWLAELGLSRYLACFTDHDIDLDLLSSLSDADLSAMGVGSVGHRKRLLQAIAAQGGRRRALALSNQQAERRHMTVVFSDLVGSTAMSVRLDPEQVDIAMQRYVLTSLRVLEAHGGRLAQVQGDGLVIYFGYPRAHEDDAVRAVHAAIELANEVGQMDVEGERLAVRIGMASGLVVVGTHWHDVVPDTTLVVGETPNIAARIESFARPGEVVIADSTKRLLGASFKLDDCGAHDLKGMQTRVQLWRVASANAAATRFSAAREALGLSPLVGRQAETARLSAIWEDVRDGHGRIALLHGEAGIGKSRLARSFLDTLDPPPAAIKTMQCAAHHADTPLRPMLDHVTVEAGLSAGAVAAEALDRVGELMGSAPDAAEHARMLVHYLDPPDAETLAGAELSPEQRRQAALEAITAYLLEAASDGPATVLIEDLHWADPTTLAFLREFSERIADAPILLLVTARPDVAEDWALAGKVAQIELDRLDTRQSRTLALSLSEGRLARPVYDLIVQKADGIPLFVEELTKAVGAADPDALDAVSVPDTLRDHLRARIDQLGPAAEVAQIGAVIGREFSASDLSVLSESAADALDAGLVVLAQSELAAPVSGADGGRYRFRHALIQDAAYDSLLIADRRRLHFLWASTLADRPSGTPPELIAHHYAQAGKPPEAARYWHVAGLNALDRSANVEALRHLQNGLRMVESVEVGDRRRGLEGDLRIALGAAHRAVEGFAAPEVEQAFTNAMHIIGEEGPDPRLLDCYRGLNSCLYIRGDLQRSVELSHGVIALGTTHDDPSFEMMGRYMLGSSVFWQGHYAEAEAELSASIALSRSMDGHSDKLSSQIDPTAFAQLHLGWTRWCLGARFEGLALIEDTMAMARMLHQPFTLGIALQWSAWIHLADGAYDVAAEEARALDAHAAAHGYGYLGVWAEGLAGAAAAEGQDPAEALLRIERAVAELERTGAHLGLGWLRAWAARAAMAAGWPDDARRLLAEGERRSAGEHWAPELLRLKGRLTEEDLLAPAGDAQDTYRRAMDLAERQGARALVQRAERALARLGDVRESSI
ncbi:MAG: adenylate/guanylate cyclase domain-containing protein [Pseudomonadota bacterium]